MKARGTTTSAPPDEKRPCRCRQGPGRPRESIEEALRRSGGKVYGPGGAAELLGIKASTLASRMKVLGIAKSR